MSLPNPVPSGWPVWARLSTRAPGARDEETAEQAGAQPQPGAPAEPPTEAARRAPGDERGLSLAPRPRPSAHRRARLGSACRRGAGRRRRPGTRRRRGRSARSSTRARRGERREQRGAAGGDREPRSRAGARRRRPRAGSRARPGTAAARSRPSRAGRGEEEQELLLGERLELVHARRRRVRDPEEAAVLRPGRGARQVVGERVLVGGRER